jgi:hypothetical protein
MKPCSRVLNVAAALLIAGCATGPTPPRVNRAPALEAPIRAATSSGSEGRTTSPQSGKSYRFFQTDDPGAQVATRTQRRAEDAAALADSDVAFDDTNVFKGSARAHAKTTVAHAEVEKFGDLPALIASIPTDRKMLSYKPRIDRDTPRVAEELRNVAVCAWIVATKKEDDNDYHIILSDDSGTIFMTAEMSGIPSIGSKLNRKRLFNSRSTFEAFVAEDGRKTSNYTGWGDAVPVYVEGSLFYDTEHKPGVVGPAFARPKTSWEIHPISKILFEPGADLCQ